MKISFEIEYTDEAGNYYRRFPVPGYLAEVFTQFMHKTCDAIEKDYPFETKYSFEYPVDEYTQLSDLVDRYLEYIGFYHKEFYRCSSMVYLKTNSDYVHIAEFSYRITDLLKHYPGLTELNLFLVFSSLQGAVLVEDNIKYYIYPRERGKHHLPHVHVIIGDKCSVSISITNVVVLAGKLPGKIERKVLKKVRDNKEYLLDCWNKMTDGLEVDINYGLGITHDL